MPDKRYANGTIVFVEEDGEMKPYKIVMHFEFFNTYLLKSCENPSKVVEVKEEQLHRFEEHNATIVEGAAIAELRRNDDEFVPWFDTASDEELEQMAPPDNNSFESDEQQAYGLMYSAIGSAESILMTILHCATSDKKLSDAELLAMRDRAEELENVEIVKMIDMYFERGDG